MDLVTEFRNLINESEEEMKKEFDNDIDRSYEDDEDADYDADYDDDEEYDESTTNMIVSETIQDLLFLQKQSHIWHLQTGSYAEHTALGEFYEKLEGCVDSLAEGFMGTAGKLKVSAKSYQFGNYEKYEAISILKNKLTQLNILFNRTSDNSVLNGKISAISELFASTLYKLKELK